jgi:glycosyltransferase involved in cell wall biosynthesis
MKISVVLCTYTLDMYDHFCDAADSVLGQTYDNVEIVIIVDGTPEVYKQVMKTYDEHNNVVIKCNNDNLGLLESRNRGAELASGDVVAFIDDDAVADELWVERLVRAYEERDAIAVGGKMTPEWVASKPLFLPEEFYWLIGVTHRGFADGPGEVRNTFGSNISFQREVFLELDGFNTDIGGRKGDKNLQGGETELCARMRQEYGHGVWYNPEAEVAHKVFDYRTKLWWLVDRAFWQGYSKRTIEASVKNESGEEGEFLRRLIYDFIPSHASNALHSPSPSEVSQFIFLFVFAAVVGSGYAYGTLD